MPGISKIERWRRRHVNGWSAEAIRDEEGRWATAAHRVGRGGTFSLVGDLELARAVAESQIPRHACSEWTCGPWIRNGAACAESITPDQKILVQTSFATVAPHADAAGLLFYRRLFDMDPSLRPLFFGDMSEQGRKLMTMVELTVSGLDRLDELLAVIQALGIRHAHYGVQEAHYDSFAAALLWTLAHELGADFTPDVQDAWLAVYGLLGTVMKESAAAVG